MSAQKTPTSWSAGTASAASTSTPRLAVAKAAGVAAVGSLVVNAIIAAVARGPLSAPSNFQALTPPVFGMFTVLGAVIGAIGWRLIVRRAKRPGTLLRRLVPTVLILSFIPDLLVLASKALPGTTTTGVLALMLMHVAVVAISVPSYQRFLPARD